jgi:hypothetical protein
MLKEYLLYLLCGCCILGFARANIPSSNHTAKKPTEKPAVIAYADPYFSGPSANFSASRYYYYHTQGLDPVGNDAISSLRVAVGYKARACQHDNGGICRDFEAGDYPTLGSLDDEISYLEVRRSNEPFAPTLEVQNQMALADLQYMGVDRVELHFGGLRSRLERCTRPKPHQEIVRCDLALRQLEGFSVINPQIRGSSLNLFSARFNAFAVTLNNNPPSALQSLVLEAKKTVKLSYFFRVPLIVHYFHALEYNIGDMVVFRDRVTLQ